MLWAVGFLAGVREGRVWALGFVHIRCSLFSGYTAFGLWVSKIFAVRPGLSEVFVVRGDQQELQYTLGRHGLLTTKLDLSLLRCNAQIRRCLQLM